MKTLIAKLVPGMAAIPFFPKDDENAIDAIMNAIATFVDRPERLKWLIDTAIVTMRKWQGVAELRALYCTRFRPADGLPEEFCTLPGFTPADCEAGYVQLQAAETNRMLAAYRGENQKLLASAEPAAEPAAAPIDPAIAARLLKNIPPPRSISRTAEHTRAMQSRERLAQVAGFNPKPVSVPATPKRTPEEIAQLEAELRAEVNRRTAANLTYEAHS